MHKPTQGTSGKQTRACSHLMMFLTNWKLGLEMSKRFYNDYCFCDSVGRELWNHELREVTVDLTVLIYNRISCSLKYLESHECLRLVDTLTDCICLPVCLDPKKKSLGKSHRCSFCSHKSSFRIQFASMMKL